MKKGNGKEKGSTFPNTSYMRNNTTWARTGHTQALDFHSLIHVPPPRIYHQSKNVKLMLTNTRKEEEHIPHGQVTLPSPWAPAGPPGAWCSRQLGCCTAWHLWGSVWWLPCSASWPGGSPLSENTHCLCSSPPRPGQGLCRPAALAPSRFSLPKKILEIVI